jgi:sulfoxide reductase heme-binding subunit YedZ
VPSARSGRRRLKLLVGAFAALPAIVIAVRFATDRLGTNPIEAALNQLGFWALVTLLASLACTPLKIVFGWNWPLHARRLLGLAAFGYASLHFLVYVVLDQFFAWDEILKDLVKRKFITVGFLALALLVPLAVTSTNRMVKRLGFPTWKKLHRLAYLAAVLGVVHFVWRVKADLREPLVFAFVLAVLFAVRIGSWARARRPASPSAS